MGWLPYNTTVVLFGAVILGIAAGAVGVLLLFRGRALLADALSHAALPGVGVGFLLGLALGVEGRPLWPLLLGALGAGLLGVGAVAALVRLPRVKADAAIGVVLSVFFAVGIVLIVYIQQTPGGQKAGLAQFIFGQAATMRLADAQLIAIIAFATLVLTAITFKELRLFCFDPEYARGLGYSRTGLDLLLMMQVALLTVVGLHTVGALLMVALLIIPAVAARFWTERMGRMALLAAVFGGLGSGLGTAGSAIAFNLPTGPAIVIACGGVFLISLMFAPQRGVAAELVRRVCLRRQTTRSHLLRALYEIAELRDDFASPIDLATIRTRRSWSHRQFGRALRTLESRGEVSVDDRGVLLTERGLAAARRSVRTHRLWEHFLTTHADIAPSHVDRAADDIEHVIGEDLMHDLERALLARGVISKSGDVPASPHQL
ncbi:MAG: iron ABC transporter, partial [Phycisphaerales bacterium]